MLKAIHAQESREAAEAKAKVSAVKNCQAADLESEFVVGK